MSLASNSSQVGKRVCKAGLLLAVFALLPLAPAQAQTGNQGYTVPDLGPQGGNSIAYGINNNGQVVGEAGAPFINSHTTYAGFERKMPMPGGGRDELAGAHVPGFGYFFVGGRNLMGVLGTNERWMIQTAVPEEWFRAADKPTACAGLAAATGRDGKVYTFGGADNQGNPLNAVESYDPPTDGWNTTEVPMPTARFGAGAATAPNGRIYVVGGVGQNNMPLDTVEAYDPIAKTWTTGFAPMPTPRGGLALTTGADGFIYALGGSNGFTPLSTAEKYDPSTDTWTSIVPLLVAAVGLAAAARPDFSVHAVGGFDINGNALDVDQRLVPSDGWNFDTPPLSDPRGFLAAATNTTDGTIVAAGGLNFAIPFPFRDTTDVSFLSPTSAASVTSSVHPPNRMRLE